MQKRITILLGILLGISVLFNISLTVRVNQLQERLATRTEKQSSTPAKPDKEIQSKPKSTPKSGPSSPSDAGFIKGLGRDVIVAELSQWRAIGLVTSYEFSGSTVVVYLNHSDWISLPSHSKADFKAGIRSKWPDGSVTFRDSQTGERL